MKMRPINRNSITDYQEVYGYKVFVATSFDSQGNPIMREKLMHGNPLQAYKQSNGAWTDTDEDNIPDIVEIIFSNTTLLDTEWRTTQPSLGGKSPEQYLLDNNLYTSYGWARDYYINLKTYQNASIAENWTQKQFNAFVTENNPPIITAFSIRSWDTTEWWGIIPIKHAYSNVTVKVYDVGYINKITIAWYDWNSITNARGDFHNSRSVDISTEHTTVYEYGAEVEIDYSIHYLTDYYVQVETKDVHNYEMVSGQKVEGSFDIGGAVADAIRFIADIIWKGLQKAWEAVTKAVDFIIEWIKELITRLLNDALRPFVEGMKSSTNEFIDALSPYLSPFSTSKNTDYNFMQNSDATRLERPFMEGLGKIFLYAIVGSVILTLIIIGLAYLAITIPPAGLVMLTLISVVLIGIFAAGEEIARNRERGESIIGTWVIPTSIGAIPTAIHDFYVSIEQQIGANIVLVDAVANFLVKFTLALSAELGLPMGEAIVGWALAIIGLMLAVALVTTPNKPLAVIASIVAVFAMVLSLIGMIDLGYKVGSQPALVFAGIILYILLFVAAFLNYATAVGMALK